LHFHYLNKVMIKLSRYLLLLFCLLLFTESIVFGQSEEDIRRQYLDELLLLQRPHPEPDERPRNIGSSFVRLGYHDVTWQDWIDRTGELPPDIEKLPSIPFLPDPLVVDEGGENIPVETMSQWEEKRSWIRQQVKHLFSGTFPDPPEIIQVNIMEEREEEGVQIEMIELRFGEDEKAKLTIELFTPPGNGPFPVFMTQWNHRGWAQIAVRRGYMALVYAGADAKDDTIHYQELYPDYDWTALMTRAWGAHRAVDYLHTLDSADKSKIALTGHSRNAKLSLFAAAFDDRITAVISSSGGTGGEFPYRYTDERHANESIDFLTSIRPQWLHPRLRFYAGREHKLPIDQNSLMALIAPNSLLLSSSIREGGGGDPWVIEQLYHSLSEVYSFLGVPEKLGIRLRDGTHGVEARDIESFIDWLDIQFQRNTSSWENRLFYEYSFQDWKRLSGEDINPDDFPEMPADEPVLVNSRGEEIDNPEEWHLKKNEIKKRINWVLGDKPAGVSASPVQSLSGREDYVNSFLNRPQVSNGRSENIAPYNALGDYLYGTIYYPTDEDGERVVRENGKLPVVIYLHEYSNTGFHSIMDSGISTLFENILSKKIAILAMDLIGYGQRIEEGSNFYGRYPHWSKLGKMVTDTRAAVDALKSLEFVDHDKIYLTGYALGGTVSLITTALDERVAGAAVSSAFTPWRDASEDIEGVKAYSHLHGLLPRLGFFAGNENRIPVDFTDIISSIAPRNLLVISPELDRHADLENVKRSMEQVNSVYELLRSSENLDFKIPYQFNRFTTAQHSEIVNWLEKVSH
jgi:cephalosporin-C deacetylase-like acetyl esterase